MTELNLDTLFSFPLDEFQKRAIAAIDAEKSVVVCVPTGSGKTLIGEYAIYRALAGGRRVFYTTPLKALSNQKLRDFQERFGHDQVGLLTGDISINRDAPILVMTTEIFRNMLYGTPIGEVGTSLIGVEAVVLDECHYMNDRQRGTVWEESIIYCPPDVQLLALSATVANSDQLTDWLNQVHGATELIYSDFRPVPLEFHFGSPKGLFPLLNEKKNQLNPRLAKSGKKKPEKGKRPESPNFAYILSILAERDMLPAIYFIFSRRGCDKAVEDLGDITLVNQREAQILKTYIDDFLLRNPEAGRVGQVEPLYRGIAAHHAGILPAWKGLVEELFQMGLVKVVFATETLAAGINMPARTTVISSLSKRTDRGHRLLTSSEFLQMAGRAGRRGMDERGHVVTLQSPFEGAKEAAYLATSGADPLVSQFTPSYGMVLNLLQTHTIEQAKALIERSFAQYLATLILKPQKQAIADLSAELHQIETQLAAINPSVIASYTKLSDRLREERRLAKTLQSQAESAQRRVFGMALMQAFPGTLLYLKGKHVPVSSPIGAVLVSKVPGSGQFPYLICLSVDNRWYVITADDVVGIHGDVSSYGQAQASSIRGVESLIPPEDLVIKPGQCRRGDEASVSVARQITSEWAEAIAPEVSEQMERVESVQAQINAHPLRQLGNPGNIIKKQQRARVLQEIIAERQAVFQDYQGQHWQEFLNLIEILQRFGALDGLQPTILGQAAAAIRGDNELWLGLALMSGELDNLDPHHLAAAVCALVTETPRPDSWTNYAPSGEVIEALSGLRGMRRQLFQLQRRYQVALPMWLEYELSGIVEHWALGVEWVDLCSNTSLDEGDIVRMLRRSVDLLSQVPYVPNLPETLRRNAYRAITLIERFPVNEVIIQE